MAWVAIDRAVKAVEDFGRKGEVDRWRRVRDEIHAEVLERGYDDELGSFVQSYDSKRLDASLLTIPLFGFLPPDDPRVRGTLEASAASSSATASCSAIATTRETRMWTGYRPARARSFSVPSGSWTTSSCCGELEEASEMFERLLALRNDLGLLSEEYDPAAKRLVGNFPQAFSHIGLINTALLLEKALQQRTGDAGREAAL